METDVIYTWLGNSISGDGWCLVSDYLPRNVHGIYNMLLEVQNVPVTHNFSVFTFDSPWLSHFDKAVQLYKEMLRVSLVRSLKPRVLTQYGTSGGGYSVGTQRVGPLVASAWGAPWLSCRHIPCLSVSVSLGVLSNI